jgi:hypothetical protein
MTSLQTDGDWRHEFWLAEVVKCSGSRFGPLAGTHSGPSLKIDDFGCAAVREQG